MAKRIRKVSKCRTHRRSFNRKTYKKKSYKNKTMRRKLYKRNTYKRRTNKRRTKRLRKRMKGGFRNKDIITIKYVIPSIIHKFALNIDYGTKPIYDRRWLGNELPVLEDYHQYSDFQLREGKQFLGWEPSYTLQNLWNNYFADRPDHESLLKQEDTSKQAGWLRMATWERSWSWWDPRKWGKEHMGCFRIHDMNKTIKQVFQLQKSNKYNKTLYLLYYRNPPDNLPGDPSKGHGYYLSNGYIVKDEDYIQPRGVYHVKRGYLVFTYYDNEGISKRSNVPTDDEINSPYRGETSGVSSLFII